jgi:hypothetical protein
VRPGGPAAAGRGLAAQRGQSIRRPTLASSTGSSVTATSTLTSGISMPPKPTLRRNGTGSSTSATSPMATVTPLKTTARPALAMARWVASAAGWPWASSSRQRVTSSSE